MTTTEREQVNLDALRNTIAAVTDDRTLGKVEFTVRGQWDGGLRLESTTGPLRQAGSEQGQRSGRFTMTSDEPTELLGSDTAASPAEYVLKALAGCYTVTLAANAAARGIALNSVQLALQADIDLAGFLGIDDAVRPGIQAIRVDVTSGFRCDSRRGGGADSRRDAALADSGHLGRGNGDRNRLAVTGETLRRFGGVSVPPEGRMWVAQCGGGRCRLPASG